MRRPSDAEARGRRRRPEDLSRAARRLGCHRIVAASAARVLARDELLERHRQVTDALGDLQQLGHRRDLLDLFLQEPLHELLAEVVALVARDLEEIADLPADRLLLIERE